MDHYQYLFESVTDEEKGILIALLSEIGFEGFEEKEDQLAGFTSKEISSKQINNIVSLTSASYSSSVIKEVNWNEKWEKDFEPVTVFVPGSNEPFVHLRAHFHRAIPAIHEIIITPKMSFGTGHHDTTHGMIERMSELDFTDKTVIDFGTGTGVLAILAEKLGAAKIIAIDNDDWSIRNAAENIKENGCNKIHLKQADQFLSDTKADIILANINLNVIVENIGSMIKACEKKSIIILSGMLIGDKVLIQEALVKHGLQVSHYYVKNNWIILIVEHAY